MRLSMKGAGVALASTLVGLFVLCELVENIAPNLQASHMWVSLFTAAPIGTASAWIEGIIANLVFGLIGGHVFAWVYNRVHM